MMEWPLVIIIAILIYTYWGTGSSASAVAQADPNSISDPVKSYLQRKVASGKFHGVVVGYVNPNGRQYFCLGQYDKSDPRKLSEHSVFEIGSVTKVFTATLLADALVRGEVTADDPIQSFLPGGVTAPTRNTGYITLGHLVTHTSSLPRLPDNLSRFNPANPYADYSPQKLYDFLNRHKLKTDTGTRQEYSNLGAGLLGHLLALNQDTDYESLVRERILVPLGMNNTAITLNENLCSRLAPGHVRRKRVSNWDIPTISGAGALRSTVDDLLEFLSAQLGLQPSPLAEAMKLTHDKKWIPACVRDSSIPIGMGWVHHKDQEASILWHNGQTGGYHSFIGINLKRQVGVAILTNSTTDFDQAGLALLEPKLLKSLTN